MPKAGLAHTHSTLTLIKAESRRIRYRSSDSCERLSGGPTEILSEAKDLSEKLAPQVGLESA